MTSATLPALTPPLIRPEVCVSRSRTVTSRSAGTVRPGIGAANVPDGAGATRPSVLSTTTDRPCRSGMNFEAGIGEPHLPVLDQHQDRDADDGLGHRHDAEDGVLLHRLLRLDVHQTVCLEVSDAAVARDERDRTGKVFAAMCRCNNSPMRLRRSAERPTSSGRAVGAAAASGSMSITAGQASARETEHDEGERFSSFGMAQYRNTRAVGGRH